MALDIVLLTGMSGSGKSVALHALEDAGYYCVDNLPPELLGAFVALEHQHHSNRVAIAVDVRSATGLPQLPQQLQLLRAQGVQVRPLFLDASTGTLVRRFSETRRRHPLNTHSGPAGRQDLVQTIERERELLAELRTSQLQTTIKELLATPGEQLTLIFQSFGFKHGLPMDADYVFDVRMLPNPHYEPELRELTGRDAPVMAFLQQHGEVAQMQQDVAQFLQRWLQALVRNHRSYVTVAIGCTGGQHRSVYLCEQLAQQFAAQWGTLVRHRELKS